MALWPAVGRPMSKLPKTSASDTNSHSRSFSRDQQRQGNSVGPRYSVLVLRRCATGTGKIKQPFFRY
jgi:hypothetical protein